MTKLYFVFDAAACFGCFGCVAACINENHTSGQDHWRRVLKLPPLSGKSDTMYLSLACNHCDNPACVKACPNNAMIKRDRDGIVLHNADRCMGCRYCQMACPYGAIVWMDDENIVGKCTLCVERLEHRQSPACVETCFGGALLVMTEEEIDERIDLDREIIGFKHHPDVKPKIRFIKAGESQKDMKK